MGLKERLRDLARTDAQLEADEIRQRTISDPEAAVACAGKLVDRKPATVAGSIRCITMPPRQSVPVLVAELFDGERSVNLVWIGRRRIAGIEPGVFLIAEGRVATVKGQPAIFNPSYQIVPAK
ncbi:OB-fold nucleic acid binding domain-containing protein [Knoellia subterranea]|uniref:DNA-binding protein n=1 Tax=Knoellia subterranea KCTC 19937 TaxID=1385521 RepID=A0A0A0JMB2_9MICO|nr:OB-fold nucleic acid binding domain-containing protein [Knoellia subterranea]KGN38525.1 DNA-binding protein [Knoellia subterranea KCTC 19937]